MAQQFAQSAIVSGRSEDLQDHELERILVSGREDTGLSNRSLQVFLLLDPQALPVCKIGPVFGPLIPVCRELSTDVRTFDLL